MRLLVFKFCPVTLCRYVIERKKVGSGGYGTCHRGLCLRTLPLFSNPFRFQQFNLTPFAAGTGQFVCVKRLKRTAGTNPFDFKTRNASYNGTSGIETIERELKMLEEVHKGTRNFLA